MTNMAEARLIHIKFPDSGKEIFIPHISLAGQSLRVQRRFPRPMPPRQKVDYGDGKDHYEYNYSHPDYRIQTDQWQRFVETETQDVALKKLYKVTKLGDEQQRDVDAWKEENPDDFDAEDTDVALWFEEIGVLTEDDFQKLIDAVRGIKEEDVDSIQDTFQGDAGG